MTHETWHDSLIQILNCEMNTAVDDDRVTELWLWHDSRDMPHVTCFTNVPWLTNVTWLTRPDTKRWDGYGSWWVSHGTSDGWHVSRTGFDSLIQKLNGEINAAVDDERVTEPYMCDMAQLSWLTWRDSRTWYDLLIQNLHCGMYAAVNGERVTELQMRDMTQLSWPTWHDSRTWHSWCDVTHEKWHDSLIQTLNCEMDAAVDDERVTELLNAHEYDFFVIAPGDTQCCSVLQWVVVYCSALYSSRWHTVLQCCSVAVCCSVLQWIRPFCYSSRWHTVSSRCTLFQFVAVYFGSVLQCVAVCRSVFLL